MRVADAVADAVHAHGVTAVFGLLGEGNIAVAERFAERGTPAWYAARREDAAVSMADGYARRSGAVGVAAITHGPGVTNAVTALTEAARARTPLVILAGDTARSDHSHPQTIDEAAVVAPTGAGVQIVRTRATAAEDVAIAFARAHRESRPIVLLLASDLADEPYEGPPVVEPPPRPHSPAQPPLPDAGAVAAAAALVARARRPALLAGRGAIVSGARRELVALAEELGAPLTTTLLGRGFFAGEPFDAGVAGGFGSGSANELLADADLVLAFGTSLSDYTTRSGTLVDRGRVLHVDVDANAVAGENAIVGDAAAVASALLHDLRAARRVRRDAAAVPRRSRDFADESGPNGLDPRALAVELDELLPQGRGLVVDLGYFTAEACRYIEVDDPRKFAFPLNFGSIGLGLATAAGAAAADRSVPTLAVIGDGGLMPAIGELETLRRHRLPVVVTIVNDSAYGIEYHALAVRGRDTALARFDDVDFAAVARSFGIAAFTARTIDELRTAGPALAATDGPLVIDAKVDGTIRTAWLEELVATGWHRHGE